MGDNSICKLEVLISTLGQPGLERLAAGDYPRVEGVRYLVGVQHPDGPVTVPDVLAERSDMSFVMMEGKGIGASRHRLLTEARGELLLLSDDDLVYDPEGLLSVIKAFDERPEYDFLSFKYASDSPKRYLLKESPLNPMPRGYFLTSFELGMRREKVQGVANFNVHFGYSDFLHAEEVLFLHDMIEAGLKGAFVPIVICTHAGESTGQRADRQPAFVECKGAVVAHIHKRTWPLRMLTHALRYHDGSQISYCSWWLRGVRKARRLGVFDK